MKWCHEFLVTDFTGWACPDGVVRNFFSILLESSNGSPRLCNAFISQYNDAPNIRLFCSVSCCIVRCIHFCSVEKISKKKTLSVHSAVFSQLRSNIWVPLHCQKLVWRTRKKKRNFQFFSVRYIFFFVSLFFFSLLFLLKKGSFFLFFFVCLVSTLIFFSFISFVIFLIFFLCWFRFYFFVSYFFFGFNFKLFFFHPIGGLSALVTAFFSELFSSFKIGSKRQPLLHYRQPFVHNHFCSIFIQTIFGKEPFCLFCFSFFFHVLMKVFLFFFLLFSLFYFFLFQPFFKALFISLLFPFSISFSF